MTVTPIDGIGATIGLYSHAMIAPAGSALLFVAGQLSVDSEGQPVAIGDFEAQTTTVFSNLLRVLAAAGGGPQDLLKMTTYLIDPDDISRFYAVRERLFGDLFPEGRYPANTLLVVQRLVRPEFLIEIEAVAIHQGSPTS